MPKIDLMKSLMTFAALAVGSQTWKCTEHGLQATRTSKGKLRAV